MPDNNKYIDRGWQQMSALLDKEMPQSPKRRPKAAWWLIAAGIALVLSGWGYHFYTTSKGHKSPVLPQTETINTGIANISVDKFSATNKETSSSSVHNVESVNETDNDASAQSNRIISEDQTSSQKINRSAAQENTDSRSRSEKKESIVENTGITNSNSNRLGSESASKQDRKYPLYQTVRAEDIVLTFEEDYPLTPPNDIALTDVGMAVRNEMKTVSLTTVHPGYLPENERGLPIQTVHATTLSAFGLEAVASAHLTSDGNPFYGVEAGLGIVLRADKRLRIHAGLSYGYYNVDGLGVFGASNADAEFLGNSGGYPDPSTGVKYDVLDVYTNNLEFREAKQLTEKFHYLHLPVSVEYKFTPRFFAAAGIKMSALLSAPARYRLNDARFSPAQHATSSKSFLYDYSIVRKFDIAPMLSLGFMLTKELSLDATYTHGLVHYINNSEKATGRNDYHRSASLGVRYRIL